MSFPNPRASRRDGLVATGGRLDVDTLLMAYRQGIFPWPTQGLPVLWYCPPTRAILEFDRLVIPRSLRKEQRRTAFRFTIDEAFAAVIVACADVRRDELDPSTWITNEMVAAYIRLHQRGYAHSVEAWLGEELVGGLYGVAVDGVFAGESMFHTKSGASKLALLHLIEHLRERGLDWIDTQTPSQLMTMLGGRVVTRDEYLTRLAATREKGLVLF